MRSKKSTNKLIGIRAVEEAIAEGKTLDKVFIQKDGDSILRKDLIKLLHQHKIHYQKVPKEKMNALSRKNHQGVIAFTSPVGFFNLGNLINQLFEEGANPLITLLDSISDIRNFGAISRSAECFGVNGIIIPEKGSAAVSEDVVKASAGAILKVKICKERKLTESAKFLKNSGIQVIAVVEDAEIDIQQVDLTLPSALVLGSEGEGISDEIKDLCSIKAKIPMTGSIKSLNVSVAAGIVFYESQRQRNLV